MNLGALLNDPSKRPALAAAGVGGVVVLALIAKKRAAASSAAPSSGSWVSAVPPANQPVVSQTDVLGQALAGLRDTTGTLLDAVNQISQQNPPPGTGAQAPTPGAPIISGPGAQFFSPAITDAAFQSLMRQNPATVRSGSSTPDNPTHALPGGGYGLR
jgi:hypothetical protein